MQKIEVFTAAAAETFPVTFYEKLQHIWLFHLLFYLLFDVDLLAGSFFKNDNFSEISLSISTFRSGNDSSVHVVHAKNSCFRHVSLNS